MEKALLPISITGFLFIGVIVMVVGLIVYYLSGLHKYIATKECHENSNKKHEDMGIDCFANIGRLRKHLNNINPIKHIKQGKSCTKQGVETTKYFPK